MSVRPAQFRVQHSRCYGASRPALPIAVIPAQAGIHFDGARKGNMDSRVRGNDAVLKVLAALEGWT
jgi:hypothetical protein